MKINDIIVLEDGKEYIITKSVKYTEKEYYLIIDINNIKNYKIIFISGIDEVEEVKDKNLLTKIALLMSKELINEEGI